MTEHKLNPMPFSDGNEKPLKLGNNSPPSSRSELLDLIALCDRRARASGYDLQGALWDVMLAMIEKASNGDVSAAKLVLDRFFGPTQKVPQIAIDVDVNQQGSGFGPPIPTPDELRENLTELIRMAQQGERFEVVDAELAAPDDPGPDDPGVTMDDVEELFG